MRARCTLHAAHCTLHAGLQLRAVNSGERAADARSFVAVGCGDWLVFSTLATHGEYDGAMAISEANCQGSRNEEREREACAVDGGMDDGDTDTDRRPAKVAVVDPGMVRVQVL